MRRGLTGRRAVRRPVDFSGTACKDNPTSPEYGASVRDRLGELLRMLEREMRSQGRWETRRPSDQALRSTEPFAVDTLEFDQWLQWIFIPKLHELLVMQLPLPGDCAVGPMAEEVYGADNPVAGRITLIVSEIDSLLSRHGADLN
jgi:uncharacterized protein YqcC (DUF446 family)